MLTACSGSPMLRGTGGTQTMATSHETTDQLCSEYESWCTANGVPYIDADEYVRTAAGDALTSEQKRWIIDFCNRWEAAQRREDARYECRNCAPGADGGEGDCPRCFRQTGLGCDHGELCENCSEEAELA